MYQPGGSLVGAFRTAQWTRSNLFSGDSDRCSRPPVGGVCGQVLGLLVPVSCTPCGASTSGLSNRWSGRGPFPVGSGERPHLEASFPLRCFQRLSLPNVANQPCTWRYNWHTRGSSVPVLSY